MTIKQYNTNNDDIHKRQRAIFSFIIIISKNESKPLKSPTRPYIYKKRKEESAKCYSAFLAVIESFLRFREVLRQHLFFGNPYN